MQQLEWDHGSLWLVRGSMVLRYRPSACIQSGKKGEKERYERELRRLVGLVACGDGTTAVGRAFEGAFS